MIFKNRIKISCVFVFTLLHFFIEAQSLSQSNLPILIIKTYPGRDIKDEPKVPSEMYLIDNGLGKVNFISDTPKHKFIAGIEFRGSTSQGGPNWYFLPNIPMKMPYGFEIWTDTTGKRTAELPLAGMATESDWVLNASYNDRTFLRDYLAQKIAKKMGLISSDVKFVEVLINGQYQGVYLLMEKIKQGKNRVPIDKLHVTDNAGDNLTGGYILKLDKTTGSASNAVFLSNYVTPNSTFKPPFMIDYPKKDSLTNSQFNYINGVVGEFEKSLAEDNTLDPTAKYRKMIDMPSFVDYFIVNELSKNVDAYRLSTYFYKERDSKGGKLKMGPVWDYNLSFGNADYYNGNNTTGWIYNIVNDFPDASKDGWQAPFWWSKLLSDSVYVNKLKNRWKELRKTVVNTAFIDQQIDSVQTVLKEPLARNFQRYPLFGKYIWPNGFVGSNMDQEIAYLKDWFPKRISWIESKIQLLSPLILAKEEELNGLSIAIYPNPVQDKLLINYSLPIESKLGFSIYDMAGHSVWKSELGLLPQGSSTTSLDLTNLKSGVYVFSLMINDLNFKQIKFIKN